MSGVIRIVQPNSSTAITSDEWERVLRSTPAVRPNMTPTCGVNPTTGQEVTIPADPSVAEILDGEDWIPLVAWDDGSAFFYPPPQPKFLNSQAMTVVFRLAEGLNAAVIDERSGEQLTEIGT